MQLSLGQNTVIQSKQLKIVLEHGNKPNNLVIDTSVFLLNATNKVADDEYFIFFNNPNRSDIGVAYNPQSSETEVILSKVPESITKIVFTLTISDGVTKQQSFKQVSGITLNILNNQNTIASFSMDTHQNSETALIIGELYRRNDEWKFRAVGQGFNGGLQPLAELYGVDIGEGENDQDSSSTAENTVLNTDVISNLSKTVIPKLSSPINLEKKGEKTTISLTKGAKVTASLKWTTNADLDLYCFYVDDSGKEDKVYYRQLGSLDSAPFIKLMGDSQAAGEEVVELIRPDKIKYALIAAYSAVSNGIGSFYSYKAKCVITDNQGQVITTHLAHNDKYSYWVALAKISFDENQVTIENVETYSSKDNFINEFKRRTGTNVGSFFKKSTKQVNGVNSYDPERSPYLFKDGSFMMSVGIREFK